MSSAAFASFMMLVLLIAGPLLQRASPVTVVTRHSSENLTVPVSANPLTYGATGVFADHEYQYDPSLMNPLFAKVLQQYNNREPIKISGFDYPGTCVLHIVAPGWDTQCREWTSPYWLILGGEYNKWLSTPPTNTTGNSNSATKGAQYNGPDPYQTMFWSNVTYSSAASDLWLQLEKWTGATIEHDKDGYPITPLGESMGILMSSSKQTEVLSPSNVRDIC
jgi:hypothetical protein